MKISLWKVIYQKQIHYEIHLILLAPCFSLGGLTALQCHLPVLKCPSCLGEGSPLCALLTSFSLEHCRASPTSIHCWDSIWMIILISIHFNDHSIQPLTPLSTFSIPSSLSLNDSTEHQAWMDLDEINPLTSSSIWPRNYTLHTLSALSAPFSALPSPGSGLCLLNTLAAIQPAASSYGHFQESAGEHISRRRFQYF